MNDISLMKVGDYVMFPNGFDSSPTLMVPLGATGTVIEVDPEWVWVAMTFPPEGYNEDLWQDCGWPENGVEVTPDNIEGQEPVLLTRGGQGRDGAAVRDSAFWFGMAFLLVIVLGVILGWVTFSD